MRRVPESAKHNFKKSKFPRASPTSLAFRLAWVEASCPGLLNSPGNPQNVKPTCGAFGSRVRLLGLGGKRVLHEVRTLILVAVVVVVVAGSGAFDTAFQACDVPKLEFGVGKGDGWEGNDVHGNADCVCVCGGGDPFASVRRVRGA